MPSLPIHPFDQIKHSINVVASSTQTTPTSNLAWGVF
jgi:hypothetical protein